MIIPPKICEWCHEPFTPKRPEQKFCSAPASCKYKALGQRLKGQPLMAAIEAKRQIARQTAAKRLTEQFGPLTDREVAIFGAGYRRGYDDGYNVAYAPIRRWRA